MAKTDEQRGPVAAWARRERLARGWTQKQVADKLGIGEVSYRGNEAGRVSKPVQEALEAIYGTKAPDPYTPSATPGDMAALIAALSEQTMAINRLIDFLGSDAVDRAVQRVAVQLGLLPSQDDEDPHEDELEPRDAADKALPQST